VPNFIKIDQTVAEIWRFNVFFQNGDRPSSWICWARIGTTHDDYLVVSRPIVVQNLVGIDAVVSITFNILPHFAPIHALFVRVLGDHPKMGSNINETPKRHILARVRVV